MICLSYWNTLEENMIIVATEKYNTQSQLSKKIRWYHWMMQYERRFHDQTKGIYKPLNLIYILFNLFETVQFVKR